MATAPPDTMQMPQQGANPFADPNTMAVYDQMRQTTSPKAFGDEMLAGAAQADPQAVAKFLQKLQSLNVPPEVLDALNNVVDEILANPERYDELRAKYIAQGLPEKILPAQFDPQFFVALNMAIDQMIAEPAGVQSFARGGIAELKSIAKVIASYGRDGDTMLAHITPAEARMLRRRGGSGTINPDTGLPEFKTFFERAGDVVGDVVGGVGDAIGDAIGGIGDAVQDFVSSDVGKIVTTVAIGYFLGPAVAAQFGVTSAVGVAAISGFVGGAGGTLLGGGSFTDALKAGAIGGLTAGAGASVFGGSDPFAARPSITPSQAFQGQVDSFTGMFSPTPGGIEAIGPNVAPAPPPSDPLGDFIQQNDAARAAASTPARITSEVINVPTPVNPPPQVVADASPKGNFTNLQSGTPPAAVSTAPPGTYKTPTIGESFTKMGEGLGMGKEPASFKTFAQGAGDLFAPGPTNEQLLSQAQEIMKATPGTSLKDAMALAKDMGPGILRTYGPATVAGLGALAAFGGFETKPVQTGPITQSLTKPVTQRIAEAGTQRQMYSQGLPGVVYDQYGAPVYGQSVRLPTYDVPDYNSGGYGMPSNLMPRQYAADGGLIQKFAFGGDAVGDSLKDVLKSVSPYTYSPEEQAAQKAARDAVAQQKAFRKSQGSGQMYNNINAGIGALAPETNPKDPTDTAFGMRSRLLGLAGLEKAYGPMLKDQRDAMNQQAGILSGGTIVPFPKQGEAMGNTLTADIAKSLMQRSMTGGAPTSEFDRYGGYEKVKALYDAGGGGYGGPQPTTPVPTVVTPPVAAANPYSNITGPQAAQTGYTGPNLYGQALAIGMPARDAMLPAYEYTPLAAGKTTRPASTYSTGNTPASEATRKETQYQGLLDQGATPTQIRYARETMFGPQTSTGKSTFMNMGGIATLGAGGYPRRTGQISGPGTEKSDSIPAMLSDGEFVMTAKAVRNAGKGSRRAGAKKMYALMHRLEKNSERG